MKADKEAQEMTRRRAEEAQRQHLLQRIGNGTPGQPVVRDIHLSYPSHTNGHHLQGQTQVAVAQGQAQGQAQAQGQPASQSAQNNNAPRPQLNGQAVPQIRTQVNISQQQRIPATNVTRVSAQMLQQAAQQRVLAAANANMAASGPNISPPHLSPGFAQRAPVSSPVMPHSSPPRTSTTPNPPRPPSASQHQGLGQPSPNLPQAVATRQNQIPGMYFSSLLGPQFTQEQIEQTMRLQLMVSRRLHLCHGIKASTATTTHDDAGLCTGGSATSSGPPCPSDAGPSSRAGPSPSAGSGPSSGPRRGADWVVPASALKPTLPTLRLNSLSVSLPVYRRTSVGFTDPMYRLVCCSEAPAGGASPVLRITYRMSIKPLSHVSYDRIMPPISESRLECSVRDSVRKGEVRAPSKRN
jgi:hypothetical protein